MPDNPHRRLKAKPTTLPTPKPIQTIICLFLLMRHIATSPINNQRLAIPLRLQKALGHFQNTGLLFVGKFNKYVT
jgi:hypothetical protein